MLIGSVDHVSGIPGQAPKIRKSNQNSFPGPSKQDQHR